MGEDRTAGFLGGREGWADVRITLRNTSGLYGGRDIFISGSGRVVVRDLKPLYRGGGWDEKRCEFRLEGSEIEKLLTTLIENDFVAVQVQDRTGIPDEVRVKLSLVNAERKCHSLEFWDGEQGKPKNRELGNIVGSIAIAGQKSEGLEPTYARKGGDVDILFAPPGF